MQNYQVKSTKNAPRWLTPIISLAAAINLTGCASLGFDLFKSSPEVKPIEVVAKPVERTPLAINLPDPISAKPFKWVVVTQDNATAVFTQIEKDGANPVLFGLTDDGYQQLSITVGEMRNLIAQYREILIKYQEYYEPKKVEGATEKK